MPKEKLSATILDLVGLLRAPSPTDRKMASVLGRLRSLIFAMPQVRLLSDLLARQVAEVAGPPSIYKAFQSEIFSDS